MANSRRRIDPVYIDGQLHGVLKTLKIIEEIIHDEAETDENLKHMNRKLHETYSNIGYLINIFESYLKHRA